MIFPQEEDPRRKTAAAADSATLGVRCVGDGGGTAQWTGGCAEVLPGGAGQYVLRFVPRGTPGVQAAGWEGHQGMQRAIEGAMGVCVCVDFKIVHLAD